jgi:hypothetical protein
VHPRTATCPAALDPASLTRRAPVLPRATRLRTSPPCSGGLRCCHVPHGSGPRLSAWEGSGAAMCHTAPNPAYLLGRAPVLPRVPRLRILPPCSLLEGGWRCHVSHDSQRVADLKNKERLSCNSMQQGSRVSKTCPRVTEAPARRAGRRRYHDLQTMRTDATLARYSGCGWQRL